MATYSKLKFSASTDGKGVLVTGTSSGAADTIHTAHATAQDLLTVFAYNHHTAAVDLTICFGGTSTGELIQQTIPNKAGLLLVVDGLYLTNSLILKAFAGTGSVITLHGTVNRVA